MNQMKLLKSCYQNRKKVLTVEVVEENINNNNCPNSELINYPNDKGKIRASKTSEEAEICSEELPLLSEETKILPEEVEMLSEEAEIYSEEVAVFSEETEILPAEEEILSEETENLPEEIEMLSGETEILPQDVRITETAEIFSEEAKINDEILVNVATEEVNMNNNYKRGNDNKYGKQIITDYIV